MEAAELSFSDRECLRRLCCCLRLVTVAQEARLRGVVLETARRRLDALVERRMLCRLSAWASDVPLIERPLVAWSPNEPPPDFGAIAYLAQARWRDRPIRRKQVYLAADKALRLFALPKRPKLKLTQASHDLGCTAMYEWLLGRWPRLTRRGFVGEDLFAHERGHGEKCEDAQFVEKGRLLAFLEYAGSYRKDRVAAFHAHAAAYGVRYLLF